MCTQQVIKHHRRCTITKGYRRQRQATRDTHFCEKTSHLSLLMKSFKEYNSKRVYVLFSSLFFVVENSLQYRKSNSFHIFSYMTHILVEVTSFLLRL